MNRFNKLVLVAGVAGTLFRSGVMLAQPGPGPGNFDPQEFRQMMLDRYRELLDVKGDDEWKAIQPRVEKVMDARQQMGFGGMGMMRGGFRGGPPPGAAGGPGAPGFGPGGPGGGAPPGAPGMGRGGFGGFGRPDPEVQALQQALEEKASADEIKAKLTALRQSRQAKRDALAKAQAELLKVLTVKQEAAAVLAGLVE